MTNRLELANRLGGNVASRGQDDQRKIGPGRLLGECPGQSPGPVDKNRFLGKDRCAATPFHLEAQFLE